MVLGRKKRMMALNIRGILPRETTGGKGEFFIATAIVIKATF